MAIHHVTRLEDRIAADDSLESSLIATVAPLMRRLRTAVMSSARWGGLTFADYAVLDLLARSEPMRQRDIARHLGVTAPVVTRGLRGLTAKRLVQRRSNPDDARSVLVTVTPSGARRAMRMHGDVVAAAAQLLQPLPAETRDSIGRALEDLQILVPPASRNLLTG